MTDVLEWTDAGRASLASETRNTLRHAGDGALRAKIAAVVERFAPCWQRGKANSDATGTAAIDLACGAWDIAALSAADAAAIASLLGARSDDDDGAFTELVVRQRGIEFALRMLVAAWGLVTDYDDPDWPNSETRLAIRLNTIGADSSSAQDASVSHGKGDIARYLAARSLAASDDEREAAVRAARAMWADVPLHVRAPVAVAVHDRELAEDIARDLFAGKTTSWPHFGWQVLPPLIRDPALLGKLAEHKLLPFSHRWLAEMGADALPYYDAAIDTRAVGKYQRERMIEQLVNVVGPATARILARYVDKAPYKKLVRAYFARHPELAPAPAVKAKPKSKSKK